jgi:hypothetical protein
VPVLIGALGRRCVQPSRNSAAALQDGSSLCAGPRVVHPYLHWRRVCQGMNVGRGAGLGVIHCPPYPRQVPKVAFGRTGQGPRCTRSCQRRRRRPCGGRPQADDQAPGWGGGSSLRWVGLAVRRASWDGEASVPDAMSGEGRETASLTYGPQARSRRVPGDMMMDWVTPACGGAAAQSHWAVRNPGIPALARSDKDVPGAGRGDDPSRWWCRPRPTPARSPSDHGGRCRLGDDRERVLAEIGEHVYGLADDAPGLRQGGPVGSLWPKAARSAIAAFARASWLAHARAWRGAGRARRPAPLRGCPRGRQGNALRVGRLRRDRETRCLVHR